MEKIISTQYRLCECCMEEHDVQEVLLQETNIFKGESVAYTARYFYCDNEETYFEDEDMLSENGMALRNAYRKITGLITTDEIIAIRTKYGITQSDLCQVLGWGEKTITRYEGFQVQDAAHDSILRKLDNDPEWFLELLDASKNKISEASYNKYRNTGIQLLEKGKNEYLKYTIQAIYAPYMTNKELSGNMELSLDKVVDMINYITDSDVKALYKVKMMKMMWYSDALSYKRYGHSITGLVYKALPMGAVPVAYDLLLKLDGIKYEEIEFKNGSFINFLPTENRTYPNLTEEDKAAINTIVQTFRDATKDEIVNAMHQETAYTETAARDVIQFKYAKELSIS